MAPADQSTARFRLILLMKTTSPIEIMLHKEKENDLEALGSSNDGFSLEPVQEERASWPGSRLPAPLGFYLEFSLVLQGGCLALQGWLLLFYLCHLILIKK